MIEHGTRFVTVNHFDTVFNVVSWDMHANGGSLNTTYDDYQRRLCPEFDQAFAALIEDLDDRGLLAETVVAVLSEFGRTPKLNSAAAATITPPPGPTFSAAPAFAADK